MTALLPLSQETIFGSRKVPSAKARKARHDWRYANDPAYRARILERQRQPEVQERQRLHRLHRRHTDPVYRERVNERCRILYHKNPKPTADRVKRRRTKQQELLREAKLGKYCQVCGENDPCCLDYHHRDPSEKFMTVNDMVRQRFSHKRILAEMAKCDLLCANCHRKHHFGSDRRFRVA
jgi:hypothetical protein